MNRCAAHGSNTAERRSAGTGETPVPSPAAPGAEGHVRLETVSFLTPVVTCTTGSFRLYLNISKDLAEIIGESLALGDVSWPKTSDLSWRFWRLCRASTRSSCGSRLGETFRFRAASTKRRCARDATWPPRLLGCIAGYTCWTWPSRLPCSAGRSLQIRIRRSRKLCCVTLCAAGKPATLTATRPM